MQDRLFDLREYHRLTVTLEVAAFTQIEALRFENVESFSSMANTYIRRKIALINDSKVLSKHSAREIRSKARNLGIDVRVQDKRIVISSGEATVMEVLAFLDEEAYRGPFTNDMLIVNSKRVLRRMKN